MAGDLNFLKVSLLLHMDGANNGTSFPDSSSFSQAATASGVVTSTTKSHSGGASAYFNGTSYLSFGSSAEFQFGAGDFSIELAVCPDTSALTGTKFLAAQQSADGVWSTANSSFELFLNSGVPTGRFHYGASVVTLASTGGAIPTTGFTHIFMGRQGNTLYLGVGGTIYTASVSGLTMNNVSLPLVLGRLGSVTNTSYCYAGYIDEARITKGVCRYTASYTPPTTAFPNGLPVLSGVIKDSANAFAARLVRAYREDTGALVGSATSNATTGVYSIPTDVGTGHTINAYPASGESLPVLSLAGVIAV